MPEPEIVEIDRDLEYLIPEYLEGRRRDVESMRTALADGDFESMRILGHNMKGTGGGYGFDAITDIGGAIQQAAINTDAGELEKLTGELADYLGRIQIRFV
ncbi:MAG: Hpt domain-containing protein [Chlorobiaceae bacterium]|nr:Hpt domain-containing protein [Chlorobiales bacterium]NTU91401.1 Hpt domain-containing protein [Chlorobiaceae bacterium]NTV25190.1 Hpt domain-containing protein [Chlorobiaceae bacterium]